VSKLTLDDISDVRAYERERDEFRKRIIELKKARRVALGPLVTIVFENRETVRFQIQEMARVERMLTDAAIQTELDIYNALIPEPNQLTATLFVELTTKAELEEWLPRLVGIERCVGLRVGEGGDRGEAMVVRAVPEADHAARLTRPDATSSVHYVWLDLTDVQVDRFAEGATLFVDHPAYGAETALSAETRAALLSDLRQ
jgi:Protein of unknown function (DUF3501)